MSGKGFRIWIVRINDVAHLACQRENTRIADRFFTECLETGAAGDEGDGNIKRRAEFCGVIVGRLLLVG